MYRAQTTAQRTKTILAITGTPGTGKKTVGRLLAKKLAYSFIDLNELAIKERAIDGKIGEDFVVNIPKLRRLLRRRRPRGDAIITGHLIPEVLAKNDADLVAVLRCSPHALERRFAKRVYSDEKIKDNVVSEILDICLAESLKKFGSQKVAEFDTTDRRPYEVASQILRVYRKRSPSRIGIVDWLKQVSESGTLSRYL